MLSKEKGVAAVTTQTNPDRTAKLNADVLIEPNTKIQEFIGCLQKDFAAEALHRLAVSGWRVASAMLTRAIEDLDAGDFASAERHRQIARQQFIEGSIAFRQTPWVIETIAAAIRAEAAR